MSITHAPDREKELLRDLRAIFNVEETHQVDLFTIRHPNEAAIAAVKGERRVVFEKHIPDTYQVVLA